MGRAHLRYIQVASILAALCSFFFGGSLVPWLWQLVPWGIHHIGWFGVPAGPFPNPLIFFVAPSIVLGLIWLAYYGASYLWAVFTVRPRSYSLPDTSQPASPISRGWPGELKWELVEHCYQRYREALKLYNPPPFDLKTPKGFYYRKYYRWEGKLEWKGKTLVLPEESLTPERIHFLLPFLAHHLADYNSSDLSLDKAWQFYPNDYPYIPFVPHWLMAITGNFLWLPIFFKDEQAWRQWRAGRVHDADTFAHYLGEGESLEHMLRRMNTDLEKAGKPDTNVPTLIERMGHLETLRKKEHERMRGLGLKPKEPPLVAGQSSPFQLNPGSDRTHPL